MESAVAILKVKRGSCYRHIRWSCFPRFMICFAPCLYLFIKKKNENDRSTDKDPHSASVTMLNKNQCVLFYSLVSLFWVNFGPTTSVRVETILFNYFGTDCNLAHLKCQTRSLNAPSRAVECCKCQSGRGRALG